MGCVGSEIEAQVRILGGWANRHQPLDHFAQGTISEYPGPGCKTCEHGEETRERKVKDREGLGITPPHS